MVNPNYTGKFGFSYSSLNRNSGIKKSKSNGNRFINRIYKFNKSSGVGCSAPPTCECLDFDYASCGCLIPNIAGC